MAARTITLQIKQPPHPVWLTALFGVGFIIQIILIIFFDSGIEYGNYTLIVISKVLLKFFTLVEIGFIVIFCIFFFRLWELAQESIENIKKPTPGIVIGFMFIPFYNLYWNFILWRNLAIHLNSLTNRNKIPVELVTIGVALSASIILSGVGFIILIITSFSFYKSAMELLPCTTTSQNKTYTHTPAKAPLPDWFKKGI